MSFSAQLLSYEYNSKSARGGSVIFGNYFADLGKSGEGKPHNP